MSSPSFFTHDPAFPLSDLASTLSVPASETNTDDKSSPAPSPMSSGDGGEFGRGVGFADLPPEVRHKIYKLTPDFRTKDGRSLTCYFEYVGMRGDLPIFKWNPSWLTGAKSALYNLTKTCRLVYEEALDYVYQDVNFVFEQDTSRIGCDVLREMVNKFPKSVRTDLAKNVVLNLQVSVRRKELRMVERLLESLLRGADLEKVAIRIIIGGFGTTNSKLEETFLDVLRSLRTPSMISVKLFGSDKETKKRLIRGYIGNKSRIHD